MDTPLLCFFFFVTSFVASPLTTGPVLSACKRSAEQFVNFSVDYHILHSNQPVYHTRLYNFQVQPYVDSILINSCPCNFLNFTTNHPNKVIYTRYIGEYKIAGDPMVFVIKYPQTLDEIIINHSESGGVLSKCGPSQPWFVILHQPTCYYPSNKPIHGLTC
jgi:hypothetical protein